MSNAVSLNDFVQRVAEELKIIAVGQELRPRDRDTIEMRLDDTLAMLRRKHFIDYSRDAIPDYSVASLTLLVAGMSAEGVNAHFPEKYAQKAQGQIDELRSLEYEPDKENRGEAELYF